jgi:hypothetical protein
MTWPLGKGFAIAAVVFGGVILSPLFCQHSAYA